MKKRILTILITGILSACVLAGCGGSGSAGSSTGPVDNSAGPSTAAAEEKDDSGNEEKNTEDTLPVTDLYKEEGDGVVLEREEFSIAVTGYHEEMDGGFRADLSVTNKSEEDLDIMVFNCAANHRDLGSGFELETEGDLRGVIAVKAGESKEAGITIESSDVQLTGSSVDEFSVGIAAYKSENRDLICDGVSFITYPTGKEEGEITEAPFIGEEHLRVETETEDYSFAAVTGMSAEDASYSFNRRYTSNEATHLEFAGLFTNKTQEEMMVNVTLIFDVDGKPFEMLNAYSFWCPPHAQTLPVINVSKASLENAGIEKKLENLEEFSYKLQVVMFQDGESSYEYTDEFTTDEFDYIQKSFE